jgi:hypothetical protein
MKKKLLRYYCREKPFFVSNIHRETNTIPVFKKIITKGVENHYPYIYIKIRDRDKNEKLIYPDLFRVECSEDLKKYPKFRLDAYQVPIEDLEKVILKYDDEKMQSGKEKKEQEKWFKKLQEKRKIEEELKIFEDKVKQLEFYKDWFNRFSESIKVKKMKQQMFDIIYEIVPHLNQITTGQLAFLLKMSREQVIKMVKMWEKQGKAMINTTQTQGHQYLIIKRDKLIKEVEREIADGRE